MIPAQAVQPAFAGAVADLEAGRDQDAQIGRQLGREQGRVEAPAGGLVQSVDHQQHGSVELGGAAQEVDGKAAIVADRVAGGGGQLGAQECCQARGERVPDQLRPVGLEADADWQEDRMAFVAQGFQPADDQSAFAATGRRPEQQAVCRGVGEPGVEAAQHGGAAAEGDRVLGRAEIADDQALSASAEGGGGEGRDAKAVEKGAGEGAVRISAFLLGQNCRRSDSSRSRNSTGVL